MVTDSATALTPELVAVHGLYVARMEITIDGNTMIDGTNTELTNFYSMLESSESSPTSSAPKPAEYVDQFTKASQTAESMFCVSVAANLSAAYDAAQSGADLFKNDHPETEIRVFDSATAASSQALITLAAARAAAEGCSIDEVEAVASNVASKVRLVAMLDTVRFIHRSGRVPKIAVWASNALNIKPVMEYLTGRVGSISRPRSVIKAIERICSEMSNDLTEKTAHINVMPAGAPERADILREWAARNLNCAELFITQFHPFMGAHTGPGLVGTSWWAE
ncbi:MAG: DegV family EDD domain-containing protein [Dehalococcoidia bacterium]|nr:DegV family EDD domain-containing protein [Dehalococcoidia bacterium]